MTTLSNELKSVITRRLEIADSREILAIVSALCADEAPVTTPSMPDATPRFEILNEELVRDCTTGLVWTRGFVPGGKRSWKESMDAAAAFTCNGWKFRAPTIAERLTINDYGRHSPAINTDVFHSEESGWEWTSTPYAHSPGDYAWVVDFSGGVASYSGRSYNGWVRGVRVGPEIV